MSSTMFSPPGTDTVQTRRTPTRAADVDARNQRSLSGKFRSLFRKTSTSPNRHSTSERVPSPEPPAWRRSPSAGTLTEEPLLRAPLVEWPFGKKTKAPKPSTNSTTKTKSRFSRKSKKAPPPPTVEPVAPVYIDQYQTSIQGQTFVPRTPELAHGSTGRTVSASSYETTTRGFRDFTVLDNPKSTQKVVVPSPDRISPPPYASDARRSPIVDYPNYHYTTVDYSQGRDTSTPPPSRTIASLEIIPGPAPQHRVNTSIQSLVENTPTLPPLPSPPVRRTTSPHQWKGASITSLDSSEQYSVIAPTFSIDAPKMQPPMISLTNKPGQNDPKQIEFYRPSTNVTRYDRPYSPTVDRNNSLPFVPTPPFDNEYPYLSAIVQHHMRPTSTIYRDSPWMVSTTSPQGNRFDASTTTFRPYSHRRSPSPTDGFIRPLTPPRYLTQPDVSVLHIEPTDGYRSTSRTSHTTSSDVPTTYRSSATIYTRDKHNFSNGGEIRTWSARDNNDDVSTSPKSSTSVFIERVPNDRPSVPLTISTTSSYKPNLFGPEIADYTEPTDNKYSPTYTYERYRQQQQQYSSGTRQFATSRYSDSTTDDRSFTLSPTSLERDSLFNQALYSYKEIDLAQEPMDADNPDVTLRHYTLKRSNSYNGIGIVLSADAETRMNPRIRDVEPASPGCRIGLRKNDRIVNVNGVNVEKLEFTDVLVLIKEGLTKDELQFSVINEAVLI